MSISMFKIGEFSKLTQVSVRMLRYYDEKGLLNPFKIQQDSNYRCYSVEQIPTLNRIKFLRDLGINVKEIKAALANWQPDHIEVLLQKKEAAIQQAIETERRKLEKLAYAKGDLLLENLQVHCDIEIKAIPGYQALSLRRTVASYYDEGVLWQELVKFMKKRKIADESQASAMATFTIYHGPEYVDSGVDMELCVPLAAVGADEGDFCYRQIPPVPLMASMMVTGPFENIAGAFSSLALWLDKHETYQMGDHSRQIVHRGPWNEADSADYLTEIQVPLKNS